MEGLEFSHRYGQFHAINYYPVPVQSFVVLDPVPLICSLPHRQAVLKLEGLTCSYFLFATSDVSVNVIHCGLT